MSSFTIARIETFVLRAPVAEPVVTSFFAIPDRVSVLVRVEDGEGAHGWGEVWCNFPSYGAEHRGLVLHRTSPRWRSAARWTTPPPCGASWPCARTPGRCRAATPAPSPPRWPGWTRRSGT